MSEFIELSKKLGELAKHLEHTKSLKNTFDGCREITLQWKPDSDTKSQSMMIGNPIHCWPNKDMYEGMHASVLGQFQERIDRLEKEMSSVLLKLACL